MKPLLAATLALVFASASVSAEPDTYVQSVATARTERLAALTKPDGWLTLIGLHFLQPGANTVGHAPDNTLVLAAGPAHLGTVTLDAAGAVAFAPAAEAAVLVDGQPAQPTTLALKTGSAPATLVSAGTVSFFVIDRGGRKALRVRDSAAERRTQFHGLEYYPVDLSWRIEADWVPAEKPRELSIKNVLGAISVEESLGKAVFHRDGRTYELLPLAEAGDDTLFFVFADTTSGHDTYTMRFLDAAPPKDGKVILDFNLAENPPCAFTPFATCPLPPAENHLPLAITAGEKIPADHRH
ncbi:MAG: DUF1684 domain-containing protein [Opitutaceae bacterium]